MFNSEQGSSIILGFLLISVICLIGTLGWYVWNTNNSKSEESNIAKNINSTNETGQDVSIENDYQSGTYDGWNTYCDETTSICFRYPSDWVPVTDGPAGPEPGNFKNPQQTLKIISGIVEPESKLTKPAYYYTKSIDNLTSASDSQKAWGGYMPGPNIPHYGLVDSTVINKDGLTAGSTVSTYDTDLITVSLPSTTTKYSLCVMAYKYYAEGFWPTKDADQWFSSDDANTSLRIIQSAYTKQ